MNEYEGKAEDFLQKCGVRFGTKFLGHGPHFTETDNPRDIFRCTFSRGRARLVIPEFGQSMIKSDGSGGNPPHPYDVLACITKYDPGDFENFCGDFGYSTDSRKAEKTYKAVVAEWKRVAAFFTAEELEALREIQ